MKIKTLGDPHLGRRFKTGVPLHRLGDREAMVWDQFARELRGNVDLHVNMGDLFDRTVVPNSVVMQAADLYINAARDQPGTQFAVLRGNHDVSRDTQVVSSFEVFSRLVSHVPNIKVVDRSWTWEGYGFVGFDAFKPTAEIVAELPDGLKAVFGHWDIVDFGGDNVIPTLLLAEKGIYLAYSGHDHLRRRVARHGVEVIVTGSMQPYSFAEDTEGTWYVTTELPLDGDFTNKNVRVRLREGESLPLDVDCLSMVGQLWAEEEKLVVDTSGFESFDLRAMLGDLLGDLSIKEDIMERFNAQHS